MRFDEGNQLATPAVQGELRADFERNKLNIAFERNESDAEAREANVREPSIYLTEVETHLGTDRLEHVLASHWSASASHVPDWLRSERQRAGQSAEV